MRAETAVRREDIKRMRDNLLKEIEEEDIAISLFSTVYQNKNELHFFEKGDHERVLKILKKLSDDSRRHKEMLEAVIRVLGEKLQRK